MNQLQGQAGLDVFGPARTPGAEQVPRAQTQVLGDQQPQSYHVAADFIRQQLAYFAFETARGGGLQLHALFGVLGLNQLLRPGPIGV